MWKLLLLLGAAAFSFGAGWRIDEWRHGAAETKAVIRTVYVIKMQGDINTKIAAKDAEVQTQIRYVTRTIVKEIPSVLTPSVDLHFPLSNGFVRLHDAASLGLPELSAATYGSDDQASTVAESEAASTIAQNYGKCRQDAERLSMLQDWIIDQSKAFNAKR